MRLRHERIGPLPGGVDRPATATYPAGAELRLRVLDVHELVWVNGGAATLQTPDARRPLLPGEVLLLPPGLPHAFSWGDGCVHGYVHAELGAPGRVAVGSGPPLAGLCGYLEWLGLEEPDGWRERAHAVAVLVAELLVTGPLPARSVTASRPAVLDALLAELRRRWGPGPPLERLRVAELAAAVHVTPGHLARSVRAAWGRPLSTLLEQLRLTRVEQLLTRTSATVATVARLCGYADAFHCSRRFSAAYGTPPARYRLARERTSLLDDPVVREVSAEVWGLPDGLG